SVAQMAALLVVFAFLIGHAVGDFLHAENRLLKLGFTVPIFGQHGDMSNAGKHGRYPPFYSNSSQSCRRLSTWLFHPTWGFRLDKLQRFACLIPTRAKDKKAATV